MEISEMDLLTLEAEIENAGMKLEQIESNISDYKHLNSEIENSLYDMNSRIARLEHQLTECSSGTDEYQKVQSELKELKQKQFNLKQQQQEILDNLEELQKEQDTLNKTISEMNERHSELLNFAPDKKSENKKADLVKKALKAPVNFAVNTVKNSAKTAITKANQFDKKINKNDVSDSGVESIRLGYTTSKKAVKTVDRTIKTTKRTVKTTKNVAVGTGKAIYRTGQFTKKAVVTTAKITETVIVHVAAALMNPVLIIIIGFMIILVTNSSALILLIGGGTSAANSNQKAYSSAAGLGDVSEQYQQAKSYFDTAVANRQSDFNSLIDNMYYEYENLPESSVVYMERTEPEPKVIYEKSFSTDDRKATLKSAWDMSLTISQKEAIAIAYVYLEKQKNEENHTEGGIYHVSYTQEVFDEILTKCVTYSDTVYEEQYCPDSNCTKHVEDKDNPAYATASANRQTAWNAYDEWSHIAYRMYLGENWDAEIGWRVDNWKIVYESFSGTPYYSNSGYDFLDDLYDKFQEYLKVQNDTPEKIEEVTYICEHKHDLHSIGLAFFTKEDIMNALEFTDNDKQWEELTEKGFEINPDISE